MYNALDIPKKGLEDMKKIRIGAAALLLLVTAAAALCSGCAEKPGSLNPAEHSIVYFYSENKGSTFFAADGELVDGSVSGAVSFAADADGTVEAVIAGTGLYRVDKDQVLLVYPAAVLRAMLSLDNRYIVFTTATELHIYDHETGAITDIKPDGAKSIPSAAISPSGTTVAYTVRDEEGRYASYAYENGESRKLSDDAYIAAVADGAEFWYFVRTEGTSLWYASAKGERKLTDNVSALIEFNRDLTEAIFDSDYETLCSVRGGRPKAIVPKKSVSSMKAQAFSRQGGAEVAADVSDCDTLFGSVFYSVRTKSSDPAARPIYDIWYVGASHKAKQLAEGSTGFALTADGRGLACMVDDTLYKMDVTDPGGAEAVKTDVYSFNMTPDGRRIYGITYERALFYAEEGLPAVDIAKEAVYTALTDDGRCLFLSDYGTTGTLKLADGVKDPVEIADKVTHAETFPGVCIYYSAPYTNEFGTRVLDVFVSKTGDGFVKAAEGVPMPASQADE